MGVVEAPGSAVVTGASSGIGLEVVRQLVARGHRVAMWARRRERLEAIAGELGNAVVPVTCDVSKPDAVAAAAEKSFEALDDISGLVNAAGIAEPAKLEDLDAGAWNRSVAINLDGTYFVSRAIAQRLREEGREGSIVNFGSELSSMGMAGYAAYCATKTAVIGMTKALAQELAPDIRVNALCPGPVDTPMWRAELALTPDPEATRRGEEERVLLGRVSEPDEIAAAAIWLLTEARFATGGLVPIDGGTTAT